MSGLSLFGIESGLHELVEAWQEAQTPEALAAAEQAIQAVVEAEVRKVDGIRAYLKFCDTMADAADHEARLQKERKQMWLERRDRLKAFVQGTMQAFGVRKLQGNTGTLSIKGNGALQPLTVADASMLPDELCDWTLTITGTEWQLLKASISIGRDYLLRHSEIKRTPNNERIRAALARPCNYCAGAKIVEHDASVIDCPECGGTGKASVPGARLEPRGEHLEIR